jgi:hypothetical protein
MDALPGNQAICCHAHDAASTTVSTVRFPSLHCDDMIEEADESRHH